MQNPSTEQSSQPHYNPAFELLLFNDFVRSLQKNSLRNYVNDPGKRRQSTIAIIFRVNPKLSKGKETKSLPQLDRPPGAKITPYINVNRALVKHCDQLKFAENDHLFELLYIHRKTSDKDSHGGHIAFPGGNLDDNETDFDAVSREVEEEIGFDLKDNKKFVLVGKLPRNFYCFPTHEGSLYMSAHIFLQLSLDDSAEAKLNKTELGTAFWVPVREFLNPDLKNRLVMVKDKQIPTSVSGTRKGFQEKLFRWGTKGMVNTEYFAFRLPNEQPLLGLTFNITLFVLQLIIENAELLQKLRPEAMFDVKRTYKLIQRGLSVNSVYDSIWNCHKRYLSNTIYYQMRQKQFDYKTGNERSLILQVSLFLLLLLGLKYALDSRIA